ncbi:MAG: hypothetical protein WC480_05275, partial [Patescibacteria group bacterium]
MKYIAISGGWRQTTPEIENLVRRAVRDIFSRADGLICGGALGVDYLALDEALKQNPAADRIKIFLPTSLEIFASHYRQRAKEGVVTSKQAEDLIKQLTGLKNINPNALVEDKGNLVVDKKAYYSRNS